MTLLLTALIMIAFAAVYAATLAMLGSKAPALTAALLRQPAGGNTALAASRAFSRA